jgi:multisubunit Na+/H+ antiporter MnhE subunit
VRFYVPVSGDSDLIAIPVVLGAIIAILAVFAAFFFVGAVTGMIVLLAVVVLAGVLLVRLIRANELE